MADVVTPQNNDSRIFIIGSIDKDYHTKVYAPLLKLVRERELQKKPDPIEVHIRSYGGDLDCAFETIALFEYAKKKGITIETHVYHVAYSSASLIAVAGHKRFVSQYAFHGLHFATCWSAASSPEQATREHDLIQWAQDQLAGVYKKYTKLRGIKKLLMPDSYTVRGGEELIRLGLADVLL